MNKRLLLPTVLFLIVLPFSILVLADERNFQRQQKEAQQASVPAPIVLYYSDMCTHCMNVEEFLAANGVTDKISFAQKNVRGGGGNARELMDKATLCGMDTETLSVPFLWDGTDGNRCLVGDVDIIKFFQDKLNAQ